MLLDTGDRAARDLVKDGERAWCGTAHEGYLPNLHNPPSHARLDIFPRNPPNIQTCEKWIIEGASIISVRCKAVAVMVRGEASHTIRNSEAASLVSGGCL